MSEQVWFVARDGAQLEGTFTAGQVVEMVRSQPGSNFMVWKDGMASWSKPHAVAEMATLLAPPAPAAPAPEEAAPVGSSAGSGQSAQTLMKKAGFIRSLFDLGFDSFVTPKMITVLYVLGMIVVGLALLAMVVSGFGSIILGFRMHAWGFTVKGILLVVLSPVIAIIYLALIRMWLELVVVLFKIKESLETMVRGGFGTQGAD